MDCFLYNTHYLYWWWGWNIFPFISFGKSLVWTRRFAKSLVTTSPIITLTLIIYLTPPTNCPGPIYPFSINKIIHKSWMGFRRYNKVLKLHYSSSQKFLLTWTAKNNSPWKGRTRKRIQRTRIRIPKKEKKETQELNF